MHVDEQTLKGWHVENTKEGRKEIMECINGDLDILLAKYLS